MNSPVGGFHSSVIIYLICGQTGYPALMSSQQNILPGRILILITGRIPDIEKGRLFGIPNNVYGMVQDTQQLQRKRHIGNDIVAIVFQVHTCIVLCENWFHILGDPEFTANIYCKSRNLPNTEMKNNSTDLR